MLLINDHDLAALITRLERTWKNFTFSDVQRELVVKHFRLITYKEGLEIINGFAMTRKYPPLPIDCAEVVKEAIKRRPAHEAPIEPSREIDCPDCFETGLMPVNFEGMETFVRCGCPHGLSSSVQVPRYKSDTYQILDFPVEKFKPSQAELNAISEARIFSGGRVEWWSQVKKIAEEFWSKQIPGGN